MCMYRNTVRYPCAHASRCLFSLLFFGAISDSGTTRRWLRGRSETDAAAGSVSSMASCLRLWSACRVAMAVESQPGLINVLETIDKGTHQMFERSLSRPKRFSERVTRGRALLARFPLSVDCVSFLRSFWVSLRIVHAMINCWAGGVIRASRRHQLMTPWTRDYRVRHDLSHICYAMEHTIFNTPVVCTHHRPL